MTLAVKELKNVFIDMRTLQTDWIKNTYISYFQYKVSLDLIKLNVSITNDSIKLTVL